MAYCSSSDLAVAVGGSAVLVQLLDKNGDGVADTAQINACLDRATAEVGSALQVVVDLSAMTTIPDSVKFATAEIAAFYAWAQGGDGQVMPEGVRSRYEAALRWLDQVAKRERTLGVVPKPTLGQSAVQVDRNPSTATVKTPTWDSTRGGFW